MIEYIVGVLTGLVYWIVIYIVVVISADKDEF